MAKQQEQTEQTEAQRRTVARIMRTDPGASVEVLGDQTFAEFTPAWERGRHKSGQWVANPNPTRITMFVDVSGKMWGWGFGNQDKVPVELKRPITQAEDMKPVLKARAEARAPKPTPEPEQSEPTTEPKPEPKKAAAKKQTTTKQASPKSGVKVEAK